MDIKYIRGKYFSHKHSFPVDFFLPDYDVIIEIDGEHWHNFPLGRDIDIQRDKELSELGYTVFRVWAEEFIMTEILTDELLIEYLDAFRKDRSNENVDDVSGNFVSATPIGGA